MFAGKVRGLSGAIVTLTDSGGTVRTARTNPFGYFRFDDVGAGQTIIVSVSSKRYQFTPQVLTVLEETDGINFMALP